MRNVINVVDSMVPGSIRVYFASQDYTLTYKMMTPKSRNRVDITIKLLVLSSFKATVGGGLTNNSSPRDIQDSNALTIC